MKKHEKIMKAAVKHSTNREIEIANRMDFVLMRQCRIDDIDIQLSKGVLYLYDRQEEAFLTGKEAYEYYEDCVSGLEPTEESREIEDYFKVNPVIDLKN